MDELLKLLLPENIKTESWTPFNLPVFMTINRTYTVISGEDLSFLLVCFDNNSKQDVRSLSSQNRRLKESAGMPVVFSLPTVNSRQREALIRNRMPYISGTNQAYLPFLGFVLKNSRQENNKENIVEKLTPAAQLLLLLFLYRGTAEGIVKSKAAELLSLTPTSITRAAKQLLALGLIREEKKGREIRMFPVRQGKELFKTAKEYMISPLAKTVFISGSTVKSQIIMSGESALAEYGMLNAPRIPSYALEKGNAEVKSLKLLDPKWSTQTDMIQLELWSYPPRIFAGKDRVDPVSLYCSMREDPDERIQAELDSLMEEMKW